MTYRNKQELIKQIVDILNSMIEIDEQKPAVTATDDKPLEMLTIKECSQAVSGLSEHTVRQLITQNKIPYIRTGQGKRGKILVNKSALLDYLNSAA
ncbi:MAG: helix-turn-helix domain-containing protein [Lachnospiraceae bacterium]|nr:helix-turn-helix domain-containing protein [Ruminococcus sp.]MCM1275855.1 helix-turn-helix domain-containing protein [Lachnospiraceae bacterium]